MKGPSLPTGLAQGHGIHTERERESPSADDYSKIIIIIDMIQ